MRTTIDIDDPILILAKQVARVNKKTLGELVSESLYKTLREKPSKNYSLKEDDERKYTIKSGIPVFKSAPGAGVTTLEDIKKLREELNI